MKDIRIGNDILVTWSLFRGEEAYDLTDLPLTLYLSNAYGKKKVEHFSVEGNKVQWTFFGKDQKNTGKYSLILVVNEGGLGMQSTDVCNFVQLVSCSCQTSGADDAGVQTETIQLTSTVDFPPIVIDSMLSEYSANPVQNAVVTKAINELKITDSPIVKGDAENSAVLKGGNNKVISEGSVALGKDNIVGLKGFYYKHIRFVSSTLANIYLSETQVTPTITTGGESKDETIIPADYLSKGDIISIVNDNKYNDVAVINNMSNGMIQIKWLSEAPFESIKIETNPSPEDYSVYCLDKPTQGISDLGKYSFANGTDNKAINTYTEVSGKGNVAKGKFAKVWGKNNKGGYNTTTFGTNNVNLADNSLVNGTNNINEGSNSVIHGNKNKNYGKRAFVVGNENVTNNENEVAFGQYNNSEDDTQFSIGIGTSSERKNAFEVKQNGDIYIEGVEGRIQDKLNTNIGGVVSNEDIYIIEDITAQDIESFGEEPLRINGSGLSEAIDSNKRVYIKYSNNAGTGIIPCSAYREDVYYVSFRLNSSLYGFDFCADSINIDETSIFYIDIQEKLESGTNIKTINGKSILGEGNLVIEGTGEGGSDNMYVIPDLFIEDILYADEIIECNVSDITSAIDANKQIYIRFADYAPGLTPCNVYREDFHYISFVYDEMLCRLEIAPGNNYVGILKKLYLGPAAPQPDWNTSDESDPAYIRNRTHYKDVEIFENGGLKTNDDGEPISPNYIRFRNEYGNLSDLILVDDYADESYIEGVPLYDEYGDSVDYIYGTLIFQPYNWTIGFTPEGDGIYYVDSVYESLKQLDEEFIPDTIARTSELTELSAEVGKKVDADFVNNAIAEAIGEAIDGGY